MCLASILSFFYLGSVFLDRVIHFGGTWGDQVKGRSPKKLKSLIEVPKCSPHESTCSKLQYDPYLISVACSYTELSISGKIWAIRKGSFSEKAKNFNSGCLSMPSESTCSKLQYNPSLISVACF